jgi:hypothetical protein
MYPWLDELLARWRREGRRPPKEAWRNRDLVRPVRLHDTTPHDHLLRTPDSRQHEDERLLHVLDVRPRE